MAFVRTEAWTVVRTEAHYVKLPEWVSSRWTTRIVAFVISMSIEAVVIALLLTMGGFSPRAIDHETPAISTIDLSSQATQATSSSASSPQAASSSTPPTKIDATTAPPSQKEWSVTTLAPLDISKETAAPPAPPSLAPMATAGTGSTGTATGAGYDPYAYASYRAPPPASASIVVPPDAIRRLEAYLRARVAVTGLQIAARIDVDNQGRIIRFVAAPGARPAIAALSSAALGFTLCDPDPRRALASNIAVTLNV